MKNIKKILVVIRLTQNSKDALRNGVALAKQFGAELSVIRAYSNPVDMEAVNAPGLFIKDEQYKNYLSVRDQYKEYLDKAIHEVTNGGFPIKEFVTGKDPVTEIVSVVEKEKIDLIVMLAHEEWRLEHLLFGGENAALLRKLPCSILLVKHEPGPA